MYHEITFFTGQKLFFTTESHLSQIAIVSIADIFCSVTYMSIFSIYRIADCGDVVFVVVVVAVSCDLAAVVGKLVFVVKKVVLICLFVLLFLCCCCTGISGICRNIVVFIGTVIVGVCVVCGRWYSDWYSKFRTSSEYRSISRALV